jgi:hypothetical protein
MRQGLRRTMAHRGDHMITRIFSHGVGQSPKSFSPECAQQEQSTLSRGEA